MKHNFLIWLTIIGILMAIIMPVTFLVFSFWWLLSGDMVSRLTWFNTSAIITALTIIAMKMSKTGDNRDIYVKEIGKENILKKLYRKLFKF